MVLLRSTAAAPSRAAARLLRVLVLASAAIPSLMPGARAALGQPPPEQGAEEDVVPPGQEELLAEMLGKGRTLPGDCRLQDGQANGPVIRGTYECSSGAVTVELRHPSKKEWSSTRTSNFAVKVTSGSPPPGFEDALVALIRSREGDFHWLSLAPPSPLARLLVPGIAAGVLAVAVAAWVVRRRLSARGARDQRAPIE